MKIHIHRHLGLIPVDVSAETELEALPSALAQSFLKMKIHLLEQRDAESTEALPDSSAMSLSIIEQNSDTGESDTQLFCINEGDLPAEYIDLLDEIWSIATEQEKN